KQIDNRKRMNPDQFALEGKIGESKIIDVRKESEYAAEHIQEAYNRPLAYLNDWVEDLDNNEHFYLHCAGGYRSMIAASILKARGYRNFTEIEGGFNAIAQTNVPRTNFVCQSKVLNRFSS
ncbi:MAG TPA: MBL fold metallo-hydrolase, partial [Cytophagales bacterium]|nr:MBL fold metallo-hydrolase [Cytophagales bacterium]